MRTVNKRFIWWLAGYYDNFMAARVVPDDKNTMTATWQSIKTHHGNAINGYAPLSTRYTYAWCERGYGDTTTTLASDVAAGSSSITLTDATAFPSSAVEKSIVIGDERGVYTTKSVNTLTTPITAFSKAHKAGEKVILMFNEQSAEYPFAHNNGIHEWLTLDFQGRYAGKYEGITHLQYPDSIVNANRQKYDEGTGAVGGSATAYATGDAVEGYIQFCNGYDTTGNYYAAIGTNDSTFGRDTMRRPDYNASNDLEVEAGVPDNANTPSKMIRTFLTGVYGGEVLYEDNIQNGSPKAFLHPIESPSGKPFMAMEIYDTSATYDPVFAYDGTLNSKGDGDIFTIRLHACAVDTASARIKLKIGCSGTAMTSTASGETSYTHAAVEYEITPVAFQEATSWNPPSITSLWDDYDFVFDYDAGTYDVYKNGTSVSTGNTIGNDADGNPFVASTMYGWSIEAKNCSKKTAVLIDHVGMIRPVNDFPSGVDMPPAVSFNYASSVNAVSTVNLTVIDDDAQLSMIEFFNQSSYADWSLLMFRDEPYRPLWRGTITGLSYSQNANDRTPTIQLNAQDYFSLNEAQLPNWELGQGGDDDSTQTVAYNRSESQNHLDLYYFGASRLQSANATLGYNEVLDGEEVFIPHADSRMRNRSAHPIQMYVGEDTEGANDPYADWDAFITADADVTPAASRSIHSRWIKDIKNSKWFQHAFSRIKQNPLAIGTLASDFDVGDSSMVLDFGLYDDDFGSIEFVDSNGRVDSGFYTAASYQHNLTPTGWSWGMVTTKRGAGTSNERVETSFVASMYFTAAQLTTAGVSIADLHQTVVRIENCPLTEVEDGVYKLVNDSYRWTIGGMGSNLYRLILCDSTSSARRSGSFGFAGFQVGLQQAKKYFETINTSTVINGTRQASVQPSDSPALYPTSINPYYSISQWNRSNGLGLSAFPYAWSNSTSPTISIEKRYVQTGTMGACKFGEVTLTIPTTNFFQYSHSANSQVVLRDLDNDYKHIWILWADMRNDGNADADAGFRKTEFGLMNPIKNSYTISLVYADSDNTSEESRQEFVDLVVGEDLQIWSMNGLKDPVTNASWSSITGGSDSESNSKYHDWGDKAGSFLIIDTSQFFNLNTYTNGGKTGQVAGGRKEIGDYLVETEGFPVLIDNYWVQAPSMPSNTFYTNSAYWNSNAIKLTSNPASVLTDIEIGDRLIQLSDDIYPFASATNSVAQIVSHSKEEVFHFQIGRKFNEETSVPYSIDANGVATFDTSGIATGSIKYLREGHRIQITDGTSNVVDGSRVVASSDAVMSTNSFNTEFTVTGINATSGSGTATINSEFTYEMTKLTKFVNGGIATSTAGEWNGTGYGGTNTNNSASSLILAASTTGALRAIKVTGEGQDVYTDATAYWGLANIFPLRLMMEINGYVENRGSLTHSESDKIRVLWNDCLVDNWLSQSALYGMVDINTVPVTKNMTTTQQEVPVGSYILSTTASVGSTVTVNTADSGGSVAPHGLFDGTVITIIENSELTDSADDYRANYTISNVTPTTFDITKSGASITNGEGYWRVANTVDDYGSVNDSRTNNAMSIFSSIQASSGVSETYGVRNVFSWLMGRDSQPSLRPTYNSGFAFTRDNLTFSSLDTNSAAQITNVRVFYGNGSSFVDYPEPTLTQKPRWEILEMPDIDSKADALLMAKQEYEKNKDATMQVKTRILRHGDSHNMGGGNDTMLYNARYGYIADQSRTIPRVFTIGSSTYTDNKAWAWASLWGGNLFAGNTNALDGRNGNSGEAHISGSMSFDENYFWYGANSLSYALQIVHIPHGMPKTTERSTSGSNITADGHLRVVIDIDDSAEFTSVDNARFNIRLLDLEFDNSTFEAQAIVTDNLSTTTIDANGFYELPIPASYWTNQTGNERIVVSVNYEYLKALLRTRCGTSNLHKNAHTWLIGYSSYNTDSIFPLGARRFGDADYWNLRAEWYAPRLHITDDINFVPATSLTLTDSVFSFNNEAMQIQNISWSVNGADRESLELTLERDVSRAAKGFMSYIVPPSSKKTRSSHSGFGVGQGDVSSSSNNGRSYNGQWGGHGSWGDGFTNSNPNAELTIINNPSRRTGVPDGITANIGNAINIGNNSISPNMLKQMKGVMEFNNDSMTGGGFAVLGQKKPSAAPQNTDGAYGVTMSAEGGDANTDADGISFAGATDDTTSYSSHSISVPVPPATQSETFTVTGRVEMTSTGTAVLFCKVQCLETGAGSTLEPYTVTSSTNGSVVLFSGSLSGANITGNTIKVSIARQAGEGDDTATYSAVTVKNVQIRFNTSSVSGSSQSGQLSY